MGGSGLMSLAGIELIPLPQIRSKIDVETKAVNLVF